MHRTGQRDALRRPLHGGDVGAARRRFRLGDRPISDFSVSLNPLGPPAVVLRELAGAAERSREYPEPHARTLAHALAAQHRVPRASVVVGNGSNELIYLVARATGCRRACVLAPTYGEYARASRAAGLPVCHAIARRADLAMDPVPVRAGDLVWLGNPNNPTGGAWDRRRLLDWIDAEPAATFVVDEAFLPFCGDEPARTLVGAAPERSNLIVLRSLTKFYAIPGLRVGYLAAAAPLARRVHAQQPAWSVNGLAQAAGLAAIGDAVYAAATRAYVAAARHRLHGGLGALRWLDVLPGQANFLLVRLAPCFRSAQRVQAALARRGLLVRDAAGFHGLHPRHLRVAVRRDEENARLLAGLGEVLEAHA